VLESAFASPIEGFYVSGGTVPLESPSYVERSADAALFEALSAGRFCYVLTSRQMGKSSLCVRTMARLQASGARPAFIDLTKIGGRNVTPDQWYAGLTVEVGRALGLRNEMLRNWQEERDLSPMQRFFSALRDVALEKIQAPIVVFVDEIDATRSLPFSANEFFAGIRECHNRRVHDPAYKRLAFCLLGVAVPGDLIADPTTTPFNIGERIVLSDFTDQEAMPLAAGLGPGGAEILRRILHWTHGHPFLTQSLAATAQSNGDVHSAADVDRLVADMLFQAKARETNINLADVGNRILGGSPDPKEVAKYRADVLSMYENALKGREVFDDESNRLAAVLKLSGIVRVEDRRLTVRNRIYERVFDRKWVRENMPGAELRRQRRAFLKGALRTGLVAVIVLAVIAALALRAVRERDRANYEVYVATMNLMRPTWEQNNVSRLDELLESVRNSPARGWEWDYWHRMSHLHVSELPKKLATTYYTKYAPDGKVYVREEGEIWQYDPATGRLTDLMPMLGRTTGNLIPFAGGKRLLEWDGVQTAQVIDLASRKRMAELEDYGYWGTDTITADGRWLVGGRQTEWSFGSSNTFQSAVLWDLESGKSTRIPTGRMRWIAIAADGKTIAALELDPRPGVTRLRAVIREFGTWRILATLEPEGTALAVAFSPAGDWLVTASWGGLVQIWDTKTHHEIARTRASESVVNRLEFSNDGTWLALTAYKDRVARLYDVSGREMRLLESFRDAQTAEISPDKAHIMTSFFTMRFYDPKTYVETPGASAGLDAADEAEALSGGSPALARSGDKAYEIDPLTGKSRELHWFAGRPLLLPEAGESWGMAQREDGTLEILDFVHQRSVMTLPKGTAPPQGFRQFPDGRRVVLVNPDKTIDIWDTAAARVVQRLHGADVPQAAKVPPDGRYLAVSYVSSMLSIWDTATWTERRFPRVGANIWDMTFSRDSTRLLAGTGNNTAEVWDVRSGRLLGALQGHSQGVEDASYSPDGTRIVTASDDGTVRIWDAATFRELTTVGAHRQSAVRARFTSDGQAILSIDLLSNAKLWLTTTPAGSAK
jgi:WD40 repeat protein